jgi:MSHA biogenesis protein MshP
MTRAGSHVVAAVRRSAGAGLVTAIFLIVVLAGLAVAMVSIFSTQQASSSLDLQGARAYQAARAGIEWGLFQQLRNQRCAAADGSAGVTSFALPATSSLSGFVVTVRCELIHGPAPDDEHTLDRRLLTATACNLRPAGGACPAASTDPDYVQRRLEVQL